MRQFTKKKSTFYTGTTGRQVRSIASRAVAKDILLVGDYLFSGPAANVYGLYQLEPEMVLAHLPVTAAELKTALTHLTDLGFSHVDELTRWVWVVEMAAQQLEAPLKAQDNQVRAAKRWYATLPKGCPFLGIFYDRYVTDLCFDTQQANSPSVPRRGPGSVSTVAPTLDLAPEDAAPAELELVAPGPKKPTTMAVVASGWREATFAEFWAIYPKPAGRKEAMQEWTEHVKTEGDAAHVLAQLVKLRPFFNYESDGKYILDPCRWIKRHRWEDEPPAMPNMNARTQSTAKAVAQATRRGAPR